MTEPAATANQPPALRPVDRLLVAALAAGPIGVVIDQLASYVLVMPAARSGSKLGLHTLTLVALAACAAGAAAAFKVLHDVPAERSDAEAEDADTWRSRSRFLAVFGLALAVFSALTIAGFAIPKLLLSPED